MSEAGDEAGNEPVAAVRGAEGDPGGLALSGAGLAAGPCAAG